MGLLSIGAIGLAGSISALGGTQGTGVAAAGAISSTSTEDATLISALGRAALNVDDSSFASLD